MLRPMSLMALTLHHIKPLLNSESHQIRIQHCRTDVQRVDLLTKPVADNTFFCLRLLLLGVLSRKGCAICSASCPILAVSWLQTEFAFITAEAKHITRSQSLREAFPLMTLLERSTSTSLSRLVLQTSFSQSTKTVCLAFA